MAMILDFDETEDVYARIGRWYTKQTLDEDEDGEYGSPVLKHTVWDKPIDTAKQFIYALFSLRSKYKDKNVAFCCSSKSESKYYMLCSVEMQGTELVFQFQSTPRLGSIPVDFLAHGVMEEVKDINKLDGMPYRFQCDGKFMDISELCLDIIRFPNDPELYYVIHAELDASRKNGVKPIADVEAREIPRTPDGFIGQCIGIQARSKRPALAKAPVIFEIPSVPDTRIAGGLPDDVPEEIKNAIGTLCVVNMVQKRNNHVLVDLMSFDRSAEFNQIFNSAGEFSSEGVQKKMRAVPPDAPLFFMYKGKPYEIETMEATAGNPIQCTLVPWGQLDESNTPTYKNEIELWAEWCKDPILSWQV